MNQTLTNAFEHVRVSCAPVQAAWARAVADAKALASRIASAARALFFHAIEVMDATQRIIIERIYERRMAIRTMFLSDPRDPRSAFTPKGRKVLAYWAKHAHAFAPVQTLDPIQMAKAEGRRELFALILADIFDDLPNFARLMAEEEARLNEEIVAA